jgi:hypothetical protein
MNFRTTYILFGGLGIVLAVGLLVQIFGRKDGALDATNFVLPSMHKPSVVRTDDIDRVEIDRHRDEAGNSKEETLVLVRAKSGWRLENPNVRVDTSTVDRLIDQVRTAAKDEAASDEAARARSNLAQFGLDSPGTIVTLHHKDGREWKLNLGNVGLGGIQKGVVYVTSSDRSKDPIAVKGNQLDHIYKNVNDLRARELLADSTFNIYYVRLDEPGKEPIILEQVKDREWRFQKPPFGETEYAGEPPAPGLDDTKITGVEGLLKAIVNFKVAGNEDFVESDAKDLAKYGLEANKPATLKLEIERKAGNALGTTSDEKVHETLLIGKKNEQGDKYYARLADDNAVVMVNAANVDSITKVAADPALLRNRDLVRLKSNDVDAIDIKNASGLIKIRGPVARRKVIVGDSKPRAADDKTVSDLLTALNQPRQVQSFPDPAKEKDYGFDKPEAITVSLWENGLPKEEMKELKPDEKKDADAELKLREPEKPTVKLTFGGEDKDTVYVRREIGTDKSVLAVPKALLSKLNQGPLAYLDRTIPSFSQTAEVTKIVLERGGEPFELQRDGGAWKIIQPKDLAGRTADRARVEAILADLRGLRPVKFEAEGAEDLEKYGLKSPAIKATVTIKDKDGKPEDWVYLFGSETPEKNGAYAKQGNKDVVFVAPTETLETLRHDLEDPTVFQLDVAKVKELKFTGWKQLTGSAFTLQLERKSPNSWAAKQPADFEANSAKAETFIQSLASLKAEKFVVKKGGPQPEHKLGPKDASLVIEVTLDGQKDPLTLTIGDLSTKDKAYFAQSSNLPGNVFLLAEEPAAGAVPNAINWKEVLKTPKYFSK